jgi:hydrogenase nickel incorporation protein HypB
MCATCGCDGEQHDHDHVHDHKPRRLIKIGLDVLDDNVKRAAANRRWLGDRGLTAINLMSSPGAGKTTLLERTIRAAGLPLAVIEGDQATSHDADRIRAAGAPAHQINTGTGCHLDAAMVERALAALDPARGTIVVIENVGNLVCPALFDLGEAARVVIASVTDGDDKPIKYPHMFKAADAIVLNKIDLLPYVAFDVARFTAYARELAPGVAILPVSATRGDGVGDWYGWLGGRAAMEAA